MEHISKYMNQLVEVHFYDHSWTDENEEILECTTWGRMIECTGRKVVIQCWETSKSKEDDAEYAILVRSAIFEIKPLKYDEERYDA